MTDAEDFNLYVLRMGVLVGNIGGGLRGSESVEPILEICTNDVLGVK